MKNDKKKIFDDLLFIYKNYVNSNGVIKNCDYPSINSDYIGNCKCRISRENYFSDFEELVEKSGYILEMRDGSLISFCYYFDKDDNLDNFEVSFIPYYKSDMLKNYNLHSILSKYIRIDYDKTGYSEVIHPLIHMHNNLERDGLRIPLDSPVSPSEFLYLIIRYYYNFDWIILKNRISIIDNLSIINTLLPNERNLFYLSVNLK